MATPLRTSSSVTSLGPIHWRLVVDSDSAFRIEPRGYYTLACASAVITVALIVLFWFIPRVPPHARIAICALGSAALATIPTVFVFVHHHERRLGPYIIVNREAIHLRHARRVLVQDFESFDVVRKWQLTGDGETRIAYLTLRSKSGEEIEVLVSAYAQEIANLKRAIDGKMSELMIAASRCDSSAV